MVLRSVVFFIFHCKQILCQGKLNQDSYKALLRAVARNAACPDRTKGCVLWGIGGRVQEVRNSSVLEVHKGVWQRKSSLRLSVRGPER